MSIYICSKSNYKLFPSIGTKQIGGTTKHQGVKAVKYDKKLYTYSIRVDKILSKISDYAVVYNLYYPRSLEILPPGPRLNIKTVLSTYGDFHVKDKTAVRTSYL